MRKFIQFYLDLPNAVTLRTARWVKNDCTRRVGMIIPLLGELFAEEFLEQKKFRISNFFKRQLRWNWRLLRCVQRFEPILIFLHVERYFICTKKVAIHQTDQTDIRIIKNQYKKLVRRNMLFVYLYTVVLPSEYRRRLTRNSDPYLDESGQMESQSNLRPIR